MKKILKIIFSLILINLGLVGKALANTDDDMLRNDIHTAIKDTIDGKLIYQVNVRTVYGPSDVNIYMANSDKDKLPAASTIKTMIGLAVLNRVENGKMTYSEEIKRDLDLSLRLSDNDATNRLIEALGGFDPINAFIKSFTKNNRTSLNRLMLGAGNENYTNAKDLAWALHGIYRSNSEIARDMVRSLSNSSSKRVKLLKNINPSYKSMNKTGELDRIQNDVALVETKSQAYIISVMTENDGYMDTYNQILLINQLGEKIALAFDKYELAYKNRKRLSDEKVIARLNTQEKKLAYAVYSNQILINAGKILLNSDLRAVDEMRPALLAKINDSEKTLVKSKKVLAKLSKEPIKNENDMVVNLVRLIYTNKDLNSKVDKDLAIAFYKNQSAVKAGEMLLNEAPKTSLSIRRPLLKNIKKSEKTFEKMNKFFDKLNEKS